MAGAATWRLREPPLPSAAAAAGRKLGGSTAHQPPARVLEILFLAVDERHRHKQYGRRLQAELHRLARDAGAGYLYVEIAADQAGPFFIYMRRWVAKNRR